MRYQAAIVLAIFTLSLPGAALADARRDALANISHCTLIPDDRGFLDCIDGAARQLRAQLGLPAASGLHPGAMPPAVTSLPSRQSAVVTPRPAPRKRTWLGRVFASPSQPGLAIASYTFDGHGIFTVALADGEIWRQRDNDSNRAHWRGPAPNYKVTVKEGIFGADVLEVAGDPVRYTVQRLR